ncbi:MAG: hypothetical protein IT462_17215 [Planctomycetes bacterium]|nr:hypothetical protein [Planctomycetota bacterium]
MGSDPNFRLKAFVVIAGVLGVFLMAFVAQRTFYWLKTRKREDVDTSKMEPIMDFSLLFVGGIVIWLAVEGLLLSTRLAEFSVQPGTRTKIAEIEISKYDRDTGHLRLVFYPADAAGQRRRDYRIPVFTTGQRFELQVEVVEWRGAWGWLGERGFFQFVSLNGRNAGALPGSQPQRKDLRVSPTPGGVGALVFLRNATIWRGEPGEDVQDGQIYDLYLGEKLEVELRPVPKP